MSLTTLSLDLIQSIKENYAVLKKINLSNNGLVNIENINQLPSLAAVDLSLNQIVDLRPLLALSSLTDLNLHSNLIGDANVLGQMRALVRLDLSHNCIYTVEGIEELAKIPTLRHLSLERNPLCSHVSYPYNVLSRFTTLETLDDRSVKELRQRAATVEYHNSDDDGEDQHHIELQDQVEALERVLKLQEQTLSSNVALQLNQNHGQAQFPFEQMLSMWRLKVVELLAKQEQADRERRLQLTELNSKLRALEQKLLQETAQVQTWQERCAVAQSQKKLLKLQLVETQEVLQQEIEQAKHVSNVSHQEKAVVHQLHQGLTMAKRFADRHGLRAQAALLEMTRRMDEFTSRLKLANDRVDTMQLLVEQKESHLRNLTAAFEAERRLWHHRKAAEIAHRTSNAEPSTSADVLGLRVFLRPEVEGILRSVFCACDESDCGRISLGDFHHAIVHDRNVAEVLEAAMGDTAWQQFKDLLNQSALHHQDEQAQITWGEFLLQFVEDDVLPDKHLDRGEIAALLQADPTWSASTWALVPLQLPEDVSSGSLIIDHLKLESLRQEVSRLGKERHYLLSRLQTMSRQNIRVFQNVRSQYDNELHSLRRAVADGKAERVSLEEQVRRLTSRLQEVEHTSTSAMSNLQQRLREVEAEKLALLEQQMKTAHQHMASGDVEAELKQERARFERLENEHRVLKREANRAEVRCRTLEKENNHLRLVEQQKLDAYTVQQEELATVQRERNGLLARLTELDEQVKHRDEQIAELESKQAPPAPPTPSDRQEEPASADITASSHTTATVAPSTTALNLSSRRQGNPLVQRIDQLTDYAEKIIKMQMAEKSTPPTAPRTNL